MTTVASRFAGQEGSVLQFGDSLTLARPNVEWAIGTSFHTSRERAFLEWAHAREKSPLNGWHLATAFPDGQEKRTYTAAIGCSARYLLTGEKGLPPLAEMIAMYRPQIAVYAIGMSDAIRGTPVEQFVSAAEAAVDLLLLNGTVPIMATITPSREHNNVVQTLNRAIQAVAEQRRLPLLDLYGQIERLGVDVFSLLAEDGVHLTWEDRPVRPRRAAFIRSGYLLRSWAIVRKAMDVKEKVVDAASARRS
jgi:hypothetical protein